MSVLQNEGFGDSRSCGFLTPMSRLGDGAEPLFEEGHRRIERQGLALGVNLDPPAVAERHGMDGIAAVDDGQQRSVE